jgi:hypothetical protein
VIEAKWRESMILTLQHLEAWKVIVHLLLAKIEIWHYATEPKEWVNRLA